MRKEFVVMRIDAAPDGAPYVLVTLSLAKDMASSGVIISSEDSPTRVSSPISDAIDANILIMSG